MTATTSFKWFQLLLMSYFLAATNAEIVDLKLKRDIVRFDASSLVPRLTGAPVLEPIGPLKVIPLDSEVRFFPITFDLWTRNGQLSVGTQSKLLRHTCYLTGRPGPVERHYEFNLTQLMPPLNPWRPHRRTLVLIPGFKTQDEVDWMDEMRRLWLELEDVNVIQVYWSKGNCESYNKAVTNTKIVARQIAILLYYLSQIHGQDFKSTNFGHSLHFVGHSLGAHIAGFVGQELGGRVGRITGLDPAGPQFEDSEQRLDSSDAHLVDVIHTNVGKMNVKKVYLSMIGKRISKVTRWLNPFNWFDDESGLSLAERYERKSKDAMGWFGLTDPVGHLDYYANDGSLQPGCDDDFHVCDHQRATSLYIGFLQYELATRGASDDSSRRNNRLIALPSIDYGKLGVSRSLARNCPRLLWSSKDSKGSLMPDERLDEFKRCSVPIDVVAFGPDFKQELQSDYGLPLPLDTSQRLYFLTTNKEPYVAEQQLIQLHLTPSKATMWSKGCKLTVLVQSPTEQELVSHINYEPTVLETLGVVDSSSLVLPFASPVDWRHYQLSHATISMLIRKENNSITLPDSQYLPGKMAIELTHMGTTSEEVKCQLHIDIIEARSFTASDSYNLWYGQESGPDQTPSFHLELTNTRPYYILTPLLISPNL